LQAAELSGLMHRRRYIGRHAKDAQSWSPKPNRNDRHRRRGPSCCHRRVSGRDASRPRQARRLLPPGNRAEAVAACRVRADTARRADQAEDDRRLSPAGRHQPEDRRPSRRLEATTTTQARRACPDAILGIGFAEAEFKFPDQTPVRGGSPITFFNGPRIDGGMTVISHSYSEYPTPSAILVTFRIRRVDDDRFGYRVEGRIPTLAGGAGSIVYSRFFYDRKWSYEGEWLSFVESHCPVPGPRLIGREIARFDDGRSLAGSFFGGCQILPG
jgi:hypothetical protein